MVKNEEVFYKICFDSLLEGVCVVDRDSRIIMNNCALEKIFGYDTRELVHKKIEILIPESQREIHKHHFESFLKFPKKHNKGKGREFYGLHKDGSVLDLEIGLNFFELEGEFYAKAIVSEISSRKRKELQIERQNRNLEKEVEKGVSQLNQLIAELERTNLMLKDEIKDRIQAEIVSNSAFEKEKELHLLQTKFITLASHEFKTPLSGILTSAVLIEKYSQMHESEKARKHAGTIKGLVYQLNTVLDDFLYLESIESNKYSFQLSRFKFCQLVNKIVKDAKPVLKERQRIELCPCNKPIEVVQDQKLLGIIIRNVLYNAIKYSPKGSKIKLKIYAEGEFLIIIIEDEGIGIPKEAQNYVFERFYRAKNALHIQGTGLGLNIVKRHLEKLNGSILLESVENVGTKVILKVPIVNRKELALNDTVNQLN
jgi:PAS domain S-box-containing protein